MAPGLQGSDSHPDLSAVLSITHIDSPDLELGGFQVKYYLVLVGRVQNREEDIWVLVWLVTNLPLNLRQDPSLLSEREV